MTVDREKIAQEIGACNLYLQRHLNNGENRQRVLIVHDYLQCLLNPQNFFSEQCENLRRLSLEYGFTEDSNATDWLTGLE